MNRKPLEYFSCDFETENSLENTAETNVWLACSYDILKDTIVSLHFSIDDFFKSFLFNHPNANFYFHNLAFDGNFILNYLIREGFTPLGLESTYKEHTFKACIDNLNNFYYIEIVTTFNKHKNAYNRYYIYDSLKLFPMSEDKLSKSFGMSTLKGSIDYTRSHFNTPPLLDELLYIADDVRINGTAIKYLIDNNLLNGFTIGQIAFKEFKKLQPKWRYFLPVLDKEIDDFLRASYKGGWCYCKKSIEDKIVSEGQVYDANSLYPSQMLLKKLPYDKPIHFNGYPCEELLITHPLFIIKLEVDMELKDNHLPSIQIKNNPLYSKTEYITDTLCKTELTLTNVDLELMKKQYNIFYIKYIEGYAFRSTDKLFTSYVEKFSKMKIENDKNPALRTIAKLLLNNLYGQMVKRPLRINKIPYLKLDGSLGFIEGEPSFIEPTYTAIGSFITSYGRSETITYAQLNYSRFCYADTDSIHLLGTEPPLNLPIDDTRFGYWKKESEFIKARFVRAKTYYELDKNGKATIKCAGLPEKSRYNISIEDFHKGATFTGKLTRKSVKGGVILSETTYIIKE